jgi:hypothetical protein
MTFQDNAAVAICGTPQGAQAIVEELEESGFSLNQLSVIGMAPQAQNEVVAYYQDGGQVKQWGRLSALWTRLRAKVEGWAFFDIPGIGPVLVIGPLGRWIVAALDNAAIFSGMSALGATLYSIGISRGWIQKYEAALRNDNYLIVAHGPSQDVKRAKAILESSGFQKE